MGFHIHVYKIQELAEWDTDDTDEIEARKSAIALAKCGDIPFREPDCEYLALSFPYDNTSVSLPQKPKVK